MITERKDGTAPIVAWVGLASADAPVPVHLGARLLIGTSPACGVRLRGSGEEGILATVSSRDGEVYLRAVSDSLPLRHEGRALSPGDSILVSENVDFYVGRHVLRCTRVFTPAPGSGQGGGAGKEISIRDAGKSMRGHGSGAPRAAIRADGLAGGADGFLGLQRELTRALQASLNLSGLSLNELGSAETRLEIATKLKALMHERERSETFPPRLDREKLCKAILDEIVGLGPLEDLLADTRITEIMVNSPSRIFVEQGGKLTLSETVFSSEQALLAVIERIVSTVNRRIDASSPIVDARLLDGSRVNAVIPPVALKGACLTIRRFSKSPIQIDQLVSWKSMTPFSADLLKATVEARLNIVISGGTGSGKTTLLNALSGFIPYNERIVTVEDAAELQLQQPHVVSLEARPANMEGKGAVSIRDLVKNCLRMRPDRIVVGECRGGEALDMLQAMNTGHDGSLTTGHANSPEDMLRRLETMVMMAGVDFPLRAIREQVSSAVHLIVQQSRLHSGRRLVTALTWINDLDPATSSYVTVPLVWFEQEEGGDRGVMRHDLDAMRRMAHHFGFSKALEVLLARHSSEVSA